MDSTLNDNDGKFNHSVMGEKMQPMYFNVELPVRVLFFEWYIQNNGQLAASCIGVLLFAVLYEYLKIFRQHLLYRTKSGVLTSGYSSLNNESSARLLGRKRTSLSRIFNGWHILQSVLQIIQTTMGMLLMLIYMTFNIWLAVAVSIGSGIGYFSFSWAITNSLDFGDHCQ